MVSTAGSITHWIADLKAGDHDAAQKLWERYLNGLVRLARQKLQDSPRRVSDEEDVALSAFDSFCRGAEQGRFPHLQDRYDLWQLLVVITVREAIDQVNYTRRQKRGGGKVRGDSLWLNDADQSGMDGIPDLKPTPELAMMMAEQCQRLLHLLDDGELQNVALWKMDGYRNEEIAKELGCSRQTVQRKLRLIQSLWATEID